MSLWFLAGPPAPLLAAGCARARAGTQITPAGGRTSASARASYSIGTSSSTSESGAEEQQQHQQQQQLQLCTICARTMASSERPRAAHTNQDAGIRESNFERHSTQSSLLPVGLQRRLRGSGGRFAANFQRTGLSLGLRLSLGSSLSAPEEEREEGVPPWRGLVLASANGSGLNRASALADSHTNRRSARKQIAATPPPHHSERHFARLARRRMSASPSASSWPSPSTAFRQIGGAIWFQRAAGPAEFNALIIESKKIKCPRCRSALTTSSPSPMLIFLAGAFGARLRAALWP